METHLQGVAVHEKTAHLIQRASLAKWWSSAGGAGFVRQALGTMIPCCSLHVSFNEGKASWVGRSEVAR